MKIHRCELTLKTLIKAYHSKSLKHGEPCGCAIGNMCNGSPYWINVIRPSSKTFNKNWTKYIKLREGLTYHPKELIKIESAFEGRKKNGSKYFPPTLDRENDPDGLAGLAKVFKVLLVIDEDYFANNPKDLNFYIQNFNNA